MLDNPEKTFKLLAALESALPFEVDLGSSLIAELAKQGYSSSLRTRQTVSEVSYAGDEGGIMCHITPENMEKRIFVSLTHIRIPAFQPFSGAAFEYQKHRIKKL